MPSSDPANREDSLRIAREWIEAGNGLRSGGAANLGECLKAYDKAIELVSTLCESETSPLRDDLASAWINKGIALMNLGGPEARGQLIDCFDKAIELRTTLLVHDHPWFRYNLIGVWINKGDALSRFGDDASRAAALASYDEALRLGSGMESDTRPKVSWRLALAHLNRGATLILMGDEARLADAGRSFDAAIAALGSSEDSQRLIAAYAWEGKAEVLGRLGADPEARSSARRAMALVAGLEPGALDATLVGLKARIALCASSWRMLSKTPVSSLEKDEVMDALDAADEGLRVAYGWPATRQMQSLIIELFRFASLGYASLQPQFLCEFIGDFMKPTSSPELLRALRPLSVQAVRNALSRLADAGLQRAGLKGPEIEMFGSLRRMLEDLERPGA